MTALAILVLLVGVSLLVLKMLSDTTGRSPKDRTPRPAPDPHHLPASSPRSPDEFWVPQGESTEVAGTVIAGGMLYVGRRLASVASTYDVEPALIDPSLRVANRQVSVRDVGMPYWPSYTEITPEARRAYLTWLEGGRRQPDADIGLVFLFLYGLERRVLTDSRCSDLARSELPAIAAEAECLLGIYGDNGSFRGYCEALLVAIELMGGGRDVDLPEGGHYSYELPFALKLRLGHHTSEKLPIPAELALAWAKHHPEIYFRTPARRCHEEFRQLFLVRYTEQYGDGIVLHQAKKRLRFEYRPASASYRSSIEIDVGDLPDISSLRQPVEKLGELSAQVEEELDSYSRYLGRSPDDAKSLPALALLPVALVAEHPSPALAEFRAWAEDRLAGNKESILSTREFLVHWPVEAPGTPKKRELAAYAQLLGKLSIGFEPDPRFVSTRLKPEDQVVLFRLPHESAGVPSERYAALTTVMQLAAAVTVADGTVSEEEERHLEQHLTEAMDLSKAERCRLSAHLTWLLANPSRLVTSKKRVGALSPSERAAAAGLLVALASTDGRIDKEEVRLLERIYSLLGLSREQLYSDLHSSGLRDEPVVVESPTPRTEFEVPATVMPNGSALDMSRVERTLAETKSLQAMLGQIFSDDDRADEERTVASTESKIDGLDVAHANLLYRLLERQEWPIAEFDALCEEEGLLPGGASETLNEFSFERVDLPLLEGEDPIIVAHEVAREITH